MSNVSRLWQAGHWALKQRFDATLPGLIHVIIYVKNDDWRLQVKYQSISKCIETDTYDVETAFVVQTFSINFEKYKVKQ